MEVKKKLINMVTNSLIPNGIVDESLLSAFLKVEREYFVVPALKDHASIYENSILISPDRFFSNTKVYAKLLQEAKIGSDDKVLVLPLSCGYYGAIIAHLAGEVWGIELSKNESLFNLPLKTATHPRDKLRSVLTTSLENGYPEKAPYDVIFIDGAVEKFPLNLLDQLTQRGRIVYVDHSNPNYFHGRIMYKNHIQSSIITETEIPINDLFRRENVFEF